MNVDCVPCGTRMVQHEYQFVCLKCEHRVEIEEWKNMENDIKRADEIGSWVKDKRI